MFCAHPCAHPWCERPAASASSSSAKPTRRPASTRRRPRRSRKEDQAQLQTLPAPPGDGASDAGLASWIFSKDATRVAPAYDLESQTPDQVHRRFRVRVCQLMWVDWADRNCAADRPHAATARESRLPEEFPTIAATALRGTANGWTPGPMWT